MKMMIFSGRKASQTLTQTQLATSRSNFPTNAATTYALPTRYLVTYRTAGKYQRTNRVPLHHYFITTHLPPSYLYVSLLLPMYQPLTNSLLSIYHLPTYHLPTSYLVFFFCGVCGSVHLRHRVSQGQMKPNFTCAYCPAPEPRNSVMARGPPRP